MFLQNIFRITIIIGYCLFTAGPVSAQVPTNDPGSVKLIARVLDLTVDAVDQILSLASEKVLGGTDALDLSRYDGFAYGAQRLINVGNTFHVDVGIMGLRGDSTLDVSADYKMIFKREDLRRRNIEIGKRVIFLIPEGHVTDVTSYDYEGQVLNFSDKVAIGALEGPDGKKGLFIWVFKITSLEQVVAGNITEKVSVSFAPRE